MKMSKFKVGDKVYRLEDRKEANVLWEVSTVQVMKKGDKEYHNYILKAEGIGDKFLGGNNNNGGKVAFVNFDDDLELYKTPHQRLLDLGFSFWDNSNGLQYDRGDLQIMIDKGTKTYKAYWVVDDMAFSVDLELSKILTQYLEELEKENE